MEWSGMAESADYKQNVNGREREREGGRGEKKEREANRVEEKYGRFVPSVNMMPN